MLHGAREIHRWTRSLFCSALTRGAPSHASFRGSEGTAASTRPGNAMSMDTLRHLKIATGVVKRTTRELLMYKQETSAEAEKLRQMKDAGVDEHDVSHQESVLRESEMMTPETSKRLKDAMATLETLVSNFVAPEGSEGSATQLHAQAVEALEAAKAAVA